MNLGLEQSEFTKVSDIEIPDIFYNRLKTGDEQLDTIFGDGILPGSSITMKAHPGMGKSTFALYLGEKLTNANYKVVYSSGEESSYQLAYNCKRLAIENLKIGGKTDVDELCAHMNELDFLVIDSFQSLTTSRDLSSTAKYKFFIEKLVKNAKTTNCTTFFIVQEDINGNMRGGTMLPYAVDCNIQILKHPDIKEGRILDIYKNRFGRTMQWLSNMTEKGYEFIGEYEGSVEETKQAKVPIKEQRKQKLMNLGVLVLTVPVVMRELDVQEQTAKLILTDLEKDGIIIKYGRGSSAVWGFKVQDTDEQEAKDTP